VAAEFHQRAARMHGDAHAAAGRAAEAADRAAVFRHRDAAPGETRATRQPPAIASLSDHPASSGVVKGQLSDREVEVLCYLPTMLTAGEIGAALYVSVNTIKAHTRSIYRKMGVTRRRQAVSEARRIGIL